MTEDRASERRHDFDEEAVCRRCGFDGAEWWHWKRYTPEGRASDAEAPSCKESSDG